MTGNMTSVSKALVDILSKFLNDRCVCGYNSLEIQENSHIIAEDTHTKAVIDTVRSFISRAGLTQVKNVEIDHPHGDSDGVYLNAYEGRVKFINFVLLPLPFPSRVFEKCRVISTIFSSLVDEFGSNLEEMDTLFSPTALVDPFVKGLLDITKEVYGPNGRNYNEDIRVYINRTDYLLHSEDIERQSFNHKNGKRLYCGDCLYNYCICKNRTGTTHTGRCSSFFEGDSSEQTLKLVEINTIATSYPYSSGLVSDAHKRLISEHISRSKLDDQEKERLAADLEDTHITNNPIRSYIKTLVISHELYLSRYHPIFGKHKVCIILLVDDYFLDDLDIYPIPSIQEEHGIVTRIIHLRHLCNLMRERRLVLVNEWEHCSDGSVRFSKVSTHYTDKRPGRIVLTPKALDNGAVLNDFTDCYEVSVLYYRACYGPSFVDDDPDSWNLRLLCEYSDAVKIPSVPVQLASSKRGQMVWSDPEHVDRLLASYRKRIQGTTEYSKEVLDALKDTYTAQVDPSLDSSAEIVRDAIQNPHRYVLKPQREGGVGLLFHSDISETLSRGLGNKQELSQYVLMKRIMPPTQPSLFIVNVKDGTFKVEFHNSITELGIYNIAIYDGNICKLNDTDGYLARSWPEFTEGNSTCIDMGFINSLIFFSVNTENIA